MSGYKSVYELYKEVNVRHMLLQEYRDSLISPPFCTELCKDYSKVVCWDGKKISYINLDLPPVTSKSNNTVIVNDKLYMIPYGIWDGFQTVVELDGKTPKYHDLGRTGRGQFYSGASSGSTGFSFPLGYEGTNYGIYITANGNIETRDFSFPEYSKLHMGTVYSNGRFWSMPRGDEPGYSHLVSFNGEKFNYYYLDGIEKNVRRKYSDSITSGDKLYSLPFGEDLGLTEIVEFDTNTGEYNLYPINGRDFSKKYNTFVELDGRIIGAPYGDEHTDDSNLGIVFDIETKDNWQFDIGVYHGGKYRYRAGIAYKDSAFFFPVGSPNCPIIKVDKNGNLLDKQYFPDTILGRPTEWNGYLYTIAYKISSEEHFILGWDEHLNYWEACSI